MNEIEVTMFQAGCGDSFLVTINSINEINILIDCGTRNTYYDCIKPKLIEMKGKGKVLDFVILTHMHADHIEGALHLFKENESNEISSIIQIRNVIYNGFKGLQLANYEDGVINQYDKAIFEGIIAKGISSLSNNGEPHNVSRKQDLLLSSYLLKGGYKWNEFDSFIGGIISADTLPRIEISSEASLTFISPNIENLKELNSLWEKYLRSIRKKISLMNSDLIKNAYEAYMLLVSNSESEKLIKKISKYGILNIDDVRKLSEAEISLDTKVENGSSIAFLLNFKDKNLLFLADSFVNVYSNNLLKLKEAGIGTYFDLVKVAHHGSNSNISDEFLKTFDSSIYVISTNGKYGHPDVEAISKIINRPIDTTKNKDNVRNIIISNATESIKRFDNQELKDEFHYSIQYLNNKAITIK